MIVLTRYLLRHYIRSQKYFAPVIMYVIAMLLIYSYKPNPVADSYSVTAMLLFFGAAWLGLTVMNAEPAGQLQLLVLHAGNKRKVILGQIWCAWIMQCALVIITVLYPVIFGMFERQPTVGEWMMAWSGHLVLSLLGLSLCVFLQKSYVHQFSRSMPGLITVLLLSFVQGALTDHLPEWLQWLGKVLPPAFYLVREMMIFEEAKQGSIYLTIIWAVMYAFVLLIIHVWLSGRRDLRS
ncbi:hypothetical protein [Paenibacillus xylanilyticus]|uniref:Uncharacterized protein n=1 Tax=Paenibacillus xylanilyticus TaxID=248903 RepID=A0A7Y6BWL1_9BACL|nr:hypothetical protein [Paenibacillus xylanilyticus]NUU76259.1 hypothetical protein [Paenibacillus xylanilyticus]